MTSCDVNIKDRDPDIFGCNSLPLRNITAMRDHGYGYGLEKVTRVQRR